MRDRIPKLRQLMEHAEIASKRSHDDDTQVGCVLVDEESHMGLASACNGFAAGVRDYKLPTTRPDKTPYMIHSEMNMLAMCAKEGIKTDKRYLVCTLTPCCNCMRVLYQSGIRRVVAKQKYRDYEELKKMMDITIKERVTSEGYIELTYKPRKPIILAIGSNPSNKSPNTSAFHPETNLGKEIRGWFDGVDAEVHYTNILDRYTFMNKPLTDKQIQAGSEKLRNEICALQPDLVVAIGLTAKAALSFCKPYYMSYPSSFSRFWNNKEFAIKQVQQLREFIRLYK